MLATAERGQPIPKLTENRLSQAMHRVRPGAGACLAVRGAYSAFHAFISYAFAVALTIARMPARIASGSRSHASMTAASSGSFDKCRWE